MSTQETSSSWDTIIIGSGMGGMACASALAHLGKRVLVLEQHYVAGGMTHTFKRKGFQWDVGVHALGEMEPHRLPGKVIRWLSDGKVHMNRYSHTYDTFHFPDGFRFELPSSMENYETKLIESFPREEKAIKRYITLVKEVAKSSKPHFAMRMLPPWLEKLSGPLFDKSFRYWSQRTTKEVLDELTDDDKLKAVLTGQWGYYGCPPGKSSFFIHAITVRHFWNGGYYPQGSSKVLAENILAPVKEKGGKVLLRREVTELLFEGKKVIGVKTQKGETFYAPHIVSAIGAKASVSRLIPKQFQTRPWGQNILDLKQSPCHLCLYLGLEGDIEEAGATASNQWFFETWDNEIMEWDINEPQSEAPVLYVSYPGLKDKEHISKDKKTGQLKHTAEVVTFVPWEAFEKWKETRWGKRPDDYKEFKKDLEERILEQLLKHRPQLRDKIVYKELSTPLSTTHYCRSPRGAIYGLMPTPKRFSTYELRPGTPFKGLYLAGADVGTLGVVGAMIGGVFAAAKVDRKVLKEIL